MIDGRVREQVDTLRVLTDMKMTKEEAQRLIIKKANRSELKSAVGEVARHLGEAMDRRFEVQEDALAGPAFGTHSTGGLPGKKLSAETHCLSCNRTLNKKKQRRLANSVRQPVRSSGGRLKATASAPRPWGDVLRRRLSGTGAGPQPTDE